MFEKKKFRQSFIIFIGLEILYYIILIFFHTIIPFNSKLYPTAFHYKNFAQSQKTPFRITNALSSWDGQWYMRIADAGYPTKAEVVRRSTPSKPLLDQFSYAFLPLYPSTVFLLNIIVRNTLVSAFIISLVLQVGLFMSAYYVVSKLYSEDIAIKSIFLLLFFPLGIFYRAYYAEPLFLLLYIWFCYFLIKRKWLITGILFFYLCLTKANGIFLLVPFIYVLIKDIRNKKMPVLKAGALFIFPAMAYVYLYINAKILFNDGWFWVRAHSYWGYEPSLLKTIPSNFISIIYFFTLPFHTYQTSMFDVGGFISGVIILFFCRKKLKPELWYSAIGLCLAPVFVKSFTSYSRYVFLIFPFYIYGAMKLKGYWYIAVLVLFYGLLVYASLLFINWGWID